MKGSVEIAPCLFPLSRPARARLPFSLEGEGNKVLEKDLNFLKELLRMSKTARLTPYTKYGRFSSDGTEFIIRRPDTPRPWVNFLSNGEYGLILSQTGGGYSFFLDPGWARVTRWEPANWLLDSPGRFLYLRDTESGEYWSANEQPVGKADRFSCRHGLGYTTLASEYAGIRVTCTHYVPLQGLHEVWRIELENLGKRPRTLQAFPAIEWHLGEWEQELKLRNILALLNLGTYDRKHEILIGRKNPVANRVWPWTAFMASSLPVRSFELKLENFWGRHRTYADPVEIEKGRLSNTEVCGENMVGVLEHRLTLKAGASAEFNVVIGVEKDEAAIPAKVAKYRAKGFVRDELAAVKAHWRELILDNVTVETPDKTFNTFLNVWNKYQVVMNNHWGRGVSFYHEGWGEFGYRNTAQDAMGILPLDADYAKARMLELARHQRANGQPLPGWSPILGTNDGKGPSDFPIWLPMLLMRYVKETGDLGALDQQVPYHGGGTGTLYEHAVQATRFLQDIAKSERGLPLMGTQDWNDAYDRVGIGGKGESIWLGMGLCFALLNLEELAVFKGDARTAGECRERYQAMKDLINRTAWDGDWYLYATNDLGEPIGSRSNAEGSIQLNPQTWAVMTGLAEGERLTKVLRTIDERLATPFGPVLFKPAYRRYDPKVGRITAFAPGTKENGAIFCHGGAFKIYADLKTGRGDAAWDTFRRILPCADNKDIEVYKTEPYIFAEYLIGPDNANCGEGAWTWLTGTADWTLFSAVDEMLGLHPEFAGLRIAPCLPRKWTKARITRKFRGATYAVEIHNPEGVETGVKEVRVDGILLDGSLIKPHGDGKIHQVKVVMGRT